MSKSRSGAPKRLAAGLLAGSLTILGVALAPSAGAVDVVNSERLAGATRYGTAAAIAAGEEDEVDAFNGATTAILATGENFPDALAASGLAGANDPAPILLTPSDEPSDDATAALESLGITDLIIVGGTAAVSQTVEDFYDGEGYNVTRVAGLDRYETAADIATEVGAPAEIGGLVTALVATGENYPDALAGGPVAYAGPHPILLVNSSGVPDVTEDALTDLGVEQVIVLGGTAAVSEAAEEELEDITGNAAVRLAGVNRYGTAAEIGDYATETLGFAATSVLLASGVNFPDALAGGPLGGELGAPLVLAGADGLPTESTAFLDDHSDTIADIWVLGGPAAVADDIVTEAEDAAETTGNDTDVNRTVTSRPELVSASYVETRTASTFTSTRPEGTYVLYDFDEAVTGATPTPGQFFAYASDGTRYTGNAATLKETDNSQVEVRFNALNTAALAGTITLATVNDGAVQGASGASDTNIEGDSPLTVSTSTTPAAAGTTSAPDLVSVGNFRDGSTADITAVDFTFDEAAFVQNGVSGYYLVNASNGARINCTGPVEDDADPSGGTVPGGEGTTVHTVTCEEVGSTLWSTATVARGVVTANAVDDTDALAAPGNPLQAVDVAGGSVGPDLTQVVFSPDALTGFDVVSYVFDEAVQAGVTAAAFAIYDTTGAELTASSASRSTTDNSVVNAVFPDNTLSSATYVGGNVDPAGVTDLQGVTNQGDEEGTSPSSGASSTAGRTDGPDLTGVAIASATSVTYTFDEDTADLADTGSGSVPDATEEVITHLLHLYTPDGIRLDCSSLSSIDSSSALANRDENNDNTVTCVSYVVGGTATAATSAQVTSAVVGTVDNGAVDDEAAGGDVNPEGAEVTSGSTGTPAS